MILDIESDVTAVLKAIELHNRMQRDYKPDINSI